VCSSYQISYIHDHTLTHNSHICIYLLFHNIIFTLRFAAFDCSCLRRRIHPPPRHLPRPHRRLHLLLHLLLRSMCTRGVPLPRRNIRLTSVSVPLLVLPRPSTIPIPRLWLLAAAGVALVVLHRQGVRLRLRLQRIRRRLQRLRVRLRYLRHLVLELQRLRNQDRLHQDHFNWQEEGQ
jgi:hypothetical protein